MTQTQEGDTLKLLTHANDVTETEDFSPTTVDTSFYKYLDYSFTENIPAASLTPNKETTTPIINFPPRKHLRVSSYQLNEDIYLRKCDGTHMFQSNSYSKSRKLDRALPSRSLLYFLSDNIINDLIV